MSVQIDYSEEAYKAQLNEKKHLTETQFACFNPPTLEIFPSPRTHYRMRAEFKIWQHDGRCDYAMYVPGVPKKTYLIDHFLPASQTINELMPKVLDAVNTSEVLRKKLFQCEFLSTTTGQCVITLIYHRPLDEQWITEAKTLEQQLGCYIIGRARKQKKVLSQDWVEEAFTINNRLFRYEHVEASFTQPNAHICQDMLSWATKHTQGNGGDLLELYCGNGNFTLPLSCNFERTLATEISKSSVDSAKRNMAKNGINNIEFARLSSEEFTQALEGAREFRRLAHIDLADYSFSTVLVDPPRAGLDDGTVELIKRFKHILYISCNPDTLATNLDALSVTHDVKNMALFDQFPFTHHRECGVVLTQRT